MKSTRGVTPGGTRMRETFVFAESAIAVVLLAGAAVLATSFARLIRVDPGFDADRVIAVRLGNLPADYDVARQGVLVQRLLERVRALPGVERAAAAPSLPFERGLNFLIDATDSPERAIGAVELRIVTPDYLATLGIPLLGGREFNDGDGVGAEPVAIVNEAFARQFWADASPLGRSIRIGHFRDRWEVPPALQRPTRIIGVAANIRDVGLDRPVRPTVLIPRTQAPGAPLSTSDSSGRAAATWRMLQANAGARILLVRGDVPALAEAVRAAIRAEEPELQPAIEALSAVMSRSVAAPRFRTLLVASFAGFAMLLTGIGIYGVIAAVVQQRRREIAIRLALGAQRARIGSVVARRSMTIVLAGMLVGLLVFRALRHVLAPWLYDVSPADPRVLGSALLVLSLVAVAASWLPARRATRMDPATSLQLE